MIKALLIDADGIVLKKRTEYFSDRLRADGYDFPKAKEQDFFKNIYPDIRIGKKDLKAELSKLLTDWHWDKPVDELLQYWFSRENQLDQEVIDALQKIRRQGIAVYLASDHSQYRANDLWENLGLKNYFDGHFFSCNLGTTKDQSDFYAKVLQSLQLQPIEVMLLDDESENVAVAQNAGLNARLYESIKQLKEI